MPTRVRSPMMIRAENAGNNGCQQVQRGACCFNDVDIDMSTTMSTEVSDLENKQRDEEGTCVQLNPRTACLSRDDRRLNSAICLYSSFFFSSSFSALTSEKSRLKDA